MIYDIDATVDLTAVYVSANARPDGYRAKRRRRWFPRPVQEQAPLSDLLHTGCTTCEVTA